ncbi:MAG: hypothetical protein O3A21_06765 [Proteobacteria bacterium]|nr:hypothetical protein [Pseudomonadota bacterium]
METDYELITAQRADRGADLWTAVEAAQFAHVVERDHRDRAGESESAEAFLSLFFELAEDWDETDSHDQATALAQLDTRLRGLAKRELFVHVAVVQRDFATSGGEVASLPIAVLKVGRAAFPSITIRLAKVMDAD